MTHNPVAGAAPRTESRPMAGAASRTAAGAASQPVALAGTPADVNLIAAARENERLHAELAAKDAENKALREAFKRHASHDRDCLSLKGAHYSESSCDCGLLEARAALSKGEHE